LEGIVNEVVHAVRFAEQKSEIERLREENSTLRADAQVREEYIKTLKEETVCPDCRSRREDW
jgi:hypothetical protein